MRLFRHRRLVDADEDFLELPRLAVRERRVRIRRATDARPRSQRHQEHGDHRQNHFAVKHPCNSPYLSLFVFSKTKIQRCPVWFGGKPISPQLMNRTDCDFTEGSFFSYW